MALCGLRDVRDYKAASGGDPGRLGTASPFNVKVASLRLGDFEERDVRALYRQHTDETGQGFDEAALDAAWALTQGQPWLVNALAREAVARTAGAIAEADIQAAKERLILARQTHLDSLVARLQEPRVRRIIEPLIAGAQVGGDSYDDDVSYVRDLGLVAPGAPVRVANPVYREVIVRVLASAVEDNVPTEPSPRAGPSTCAKCSSASRSSGASTARPWSATSPTTRSRRSSS